jgi:hypothetical protein
LISGWPVWGLLILNGGPILLSFVGAVFGLYLSQRHLDAIKEALKNSHYIYLWGPSLGRRGVVWSLLEIGKIAGMVLWPRASIAIGEVDPVDIENFPRYLKRLLLIEMTIIYIGLAWMAVVAVLIQFE